MTLINYEKAMELIGQTIEEYNQLQEADSAIIPLEAETKLYGSGGLLKSIELVTLLVELEYKIEEEFGISGALTSEKAMSQKNSPFRTIATLTEYIASLEE